MSSTRHCRRTRRCTETRHPVVAWSPACKRVRAGAERSRRAGRRTFPHRPQPVAHKGGDVAGTGLVPRGIRACRACENWPKIAPSGATWLRLPCPGAIRNPMGMRVDIRTCCAGDESVLRRALNGDRHLEAKLARLGALIRRAGSAGERSVVGAWKILRSGSHGQASRKRSLPRSGDQGEIRSPDRRWPCPGRSGLPTADQGRC